MNKQDQETLRLAINIVSGQVIVLQNSYMAPDGIGGYKFPPGSQKERREYNRCVDTVKRLRDMRRRGATSAPESAPG